MDAADKFRREIYGYPDTAHSDGPIQIYADAGVGIDLSISQNGIELNIPDAAWTNLTTYLENQQVGNFDIPGSVVWPICGRTGRTGSLVAILKKTDAAPSVPGEFYGISVAPNAKVPIVAVAVTGDYWHMPIVRAVGQTLADLADEYENDGPDFEAVPDDDYVSPPNILFVRASEATRLANNEDPLKVLGPFPLNWPVSSKGSLTFFPRGPSDTPPSAQERNGGVQLVEGGAGYRHRALRCDFDCIMRRMPYSSTQPIQARTQFCKVCKCTLRQAIRANPFFIWSLSGFTFLDSQQLRYDRTGWTPATPRSLQSQPFTETINATAGPNRPHWSCQVTVDDTNGLTITALKIRAERRKPANSILSSQCDIVRLQARGHNHYRKSSSPCPGRFSMYIWYFLLGGI
jgi:hypothetical protein